MWRKKLLSHDFDALPLHYIWMPIAWLLVISALHYFLNSEVDDRNTIRMGYMPVITNFAAPILDYASSNTDGTRFRAIKFASFAEMAEALRNNQIDAAFMIAPLSIVMRQQGVDVKIVAIGNRHESTFVTRADLNISSFSQLEGKTIAVPMRYSGHNLSALELIKKHNLNGRINVVEMNPPDMASALATGSLDAYYVGEPFAAKTLTTGDAELLFYVEDVWPSFICNLVTVKNDFLEQHPGRAKQFVESVARAGKWVSENKQEAARIASQYWNTDPALIEYAMNTPEDRIVYDQYIPSEKQMLEMANMMKEFGLVESNDIDGLVFDSFATNASLKNVTDIESIITGG